MDDERSAHTVDISRAGGPLVAILAVVTLAWWIGGRASLDDRRVLVRQWGPSVEASTDSVEPLRILAWNIAHGRGDVGSGIVHNWQGGSPAVRTARIARIAEVVREVDPQVVVLNEVDFDSHWSGGINQAEALARTLGFPVWVELRNYDVRLPFGTLSFGNAVLSRFPVDSAEWIRIPSYSPLESMVFGAKGASLIRLDTPGGRISLVPIHLEVRSEATRLGAVPVIDSLRAAEDSPMILAGDFNSTPPGWPGSEGVTALGALLENGWTSPRAAAPPLESEWTFPTYGLARAIDWVLVEPTLRVHEADVLERARALSDHLPVAAVVSRAARAEP